MAATASLALMTMMMACPGGYANIDSHGYGVDGDGNGKGNGASMAVTTGEAASKTEITIICHRGDVVFCVDTGTSISMAMTRTVTATLLRTVTSKETARPEIAMESLRPLPRW